MSAYLRGQSGQMLLIGVLILVVLAVAVPAIIFFNRTTTLHSIFSVKNQKGRAIAEEGVAYAMQQLSRPDANPANPPPMWPYLGAGMPAAETLSSKQGGRFTVTYSSAPYKGLQPYQVGIVARPLDAQGNVIKGASVFTRVSKKTVGVKLPSGMTTSAAVELTQVPQVSNTGSSNPVFRVEFGPIVVRDNNVWVLDAYNDSISRRPRKFSAGPISPRCVTSKPPTTDQREYWAYTSLGFPAVIDMAKYQVRANASGPCPAPTSCVGCTNPTQPTAGTCVYAGVAPGVIKFDGIGTFTAPANGVIYIDGDAEIDRYMFDMSSGAIVVNGNLTLGSNSHNPTVLPAKRVYVPPTWMFEDTYCTCCEDLCNFGLANRTIDMERTFLYVKGSLTTDDAIGVGANNWTLEGVLRVDGTLTVGDGTTLYVLYNDVVSRGIYTSNFELQIDSTTAVP